MTASVETLLPVTIPLRWQDFDYQGHVYHATVLTLLDEARTMWLRDSIQMASADSIVIARLEIDYLAEIAVSERAIQVGFQVERIGRTSVTFAEHVVDSTGSTVARAVTTAVLWDRELRRPRAITSSERESLGASMNAPKSAGT